MLWWFACGGALAAAPAVTQAELPAAIAEIGSRVQQDRLVVGTTWATNAAVKAVLDAHPELHGELHRVPESAPDAEGAIQAFVDKYGFHCGIWVTDAGSGRFGIHEVGQCQAAPAAAAAPSPTPAPAAAAPASAPAPAPAPWPVPAPAPAAPMVSVSPTGAVAGWDQLAIELTAPDPTAAILESLVIGFGSGHFYCNDNQAGYAHLGVQAGGLALSAIGGLVTANGSTAGPALTSVGISAFAISRLVEIATDPFAARKEAQRMVSNHKK